MDQKQKLIHRVGKLFGIQRPGISAVRILIYQGNVACAPISVHVDHGAGHKAEQVILVALSVTVEILVEVLNERSMVIQRPFVVLYRLVQVRQALIVKQLLVKQRDNRQAIGRECDHTRSGILAVTIGDRIIVVLHPVALRKIQIFQIAQIVEGAAKCCRQSCIARTGKHVVVIAACLDHALDLSNRFERIGVIKRLGHDIDVQAIVDRDVTVKHRIVYGIGIELRHRNLVLGVLLHATAQDHDVLSVEFQILGNGIQGCILLGCCFPARSLVTVFRVGRFHACSK